MFGQIILRMDGGEAAVSRRNIPETNIALRSATILQIEKALRLLDDRWEELQKGATEKGANPFGDVMRMLTPSESHGHRRKRPTVSKERAEAIGLMYGLSPKQRRLMVMLFEDKTMKEIALEQRTALQVAYRKRDNLFKRLAVEDMKAFKALIYVLSTAARVK